jgi:CDP-diacylglycerol--glycerol-3-phosphate 3-phosphatidyltransferase
MSTGKPPRRFTTLTDAMRHLTGGLTTRIGQRLHALGVHPDLITFVGLLFVVAAGIAASQGEFFWAAVIIVLGGPLDAIDGAVARAMQRQDKFGALFDSTLDRYADGAIFIGLATYFSGEGDQTLMLLSMIALLGSLLVSYVRARAEGLGLDCKVGLFTRMERVVVILAMLFTGYVGVGLWILAVGTHVTVLQRIWHVYNLIKQQGDSV